MSYGNDRVWSYRAGVTFATLPGIGPGGTVPDGVRILRYRLSLLMFLLYAVPGAVLPLYSLHLKELGLGDMALAGCCAAQGVAAVLAPLVAGQVADRWLAAERFLAACGLTAGICAWWLTRLTDPGLVFLTSLVFWMAAVPITLLGSAISFTHLRRPDRDFGPVRLWGTVGWVAPGWLLVLARGWFLPTPVRVTDLFLLGAGFAFLLSAYALTLPHTPPRRGTHPTSAPLAALTLLRGRSFAVYSLCLLGVSMSYTLVTQATPLLLDGLGVPAVWTSPALNLTQLCEVLSLALLPFVLARLGLRGVMLLGLLAIVSALAILGVGRPAPLVIGSLGLNGVWVAWFLVAGQVFVNRRASGDLRASAQALLSFLNGTGILLGHLLAGWLRQGTGELSRVFDTGAGLTAGLTLVFLLGFRERAPEAPGEGQALPDPAQPGNVTTRLSRCTTPS